MGPPLSPPVPPQLARTAREVPTGGGWAYERKLDGFRAIVFVDGADVVIQSRGGKQLGRYFPELAFPEGRYVIDGEIVIADGAGGEDFGGLQARIHPAASRVALLAERTPASFCAFDLLAAGDEALLELPFSERRSRLEELDPGIVPVRCIRDPAGTVGWLEGAEGVIAKRLEDPYRPGERHGMVKIKRVRTIDCVVMGWRPGTLPDTVGSLILGLYDGDGLRPVGHCSGFTAARKRELVTELAPLASGERGSGDPSRWSGGRDLEWVALRPELVAEVSFDHASGGRIRHGTRFIRFRDDREPRSCTVDQLDA